MKTLGINEMKVTRADAKVQLKTKENNENDYNWWEL